MGRAIAVAGRHKAGPDNVAVGGGPCGRRQRRAWVCRSVRRHQPLQLFEPVLHEDLAAAGALVGGLIGHEAGHQPGFVRTHYEEVRYPVTRQARRCRTVDAVRDEIAGYDVRYRYHGRDFITRLAYDPGPTLAIDLNARPADPRPQPPAWSRTR